MALWKEFSFPMLEAESAHETSIYVLSTAALFTFGTRKRK